MKLLSLIKKINLIKKIDNISSINFNFENLNYKYKNNFIKKEFINKNNIRALTINKMIFNIKKNLNNHNLNIEFKKSMSVMPFIDNSGLKFFKNMANYKIYTNYNIGMLYNLTFKKINENKYLFSKKNTNKTLNIRNQFRATNFKLLKKTSIIDLILKKYIESYVNEKISMNFDKYNINFFRRRVLYVKVLRRKLRRMRRMLKWAKISLRNFIRITLIFLCTKDIEIFSKVLLKIMNSMHYKNHRKFLYYLKLFISKSMHYYFNILKFEGFFFYLSGKISCSGNSKKKNYAIRCGKYSLTNKMLKLKFKKGLIYTKTGVLGYKLMISYR
uniref:Orf328 n=1 Tax=Tetrahymena pyriformis TaxID=5908 RepID=Q9XMT6_TETPY|nr:orf328 [Tetrahymena pyriformis]AAD41927.1 orf328 [Tetrahymena pyriformis]